MGCLAPLEQGLLAALKEDGARLLEQLIHDLHRAVHRQALEPGEQNYGWREITVLTLLGPIFLSRPYYYSETLSRGRFALDEALWLHNGYSPCVAKMMCRAGAVSHSFEAASQDLQAYAGVQVPGRQIQRMILLMGPLIARKRQELLVPAKLPVVDVMNVSVDGTGVPARPEELAGRKGKQPDGSSRTREVKLAAIFTHSFPQIDERPFRHVGSTSYIADIVEAVEFGPRVRQEAFRRGIQAALVVVFLGDGAKWVWELARVNFPDAVCILDFYHALEHMANLLNLLYGEGQESKKLFARWRKALRRNRIGWLIALAKRDLPTAQKARESAQKEIDYFENNRSRMQYKTYLDAGYFIGSGVVEAGCKSVVGLRLKQSGMRWSVEGARQILTFRCALASGLFDQLWDMCYPLISKNIIATSRYSQISLN
jgi:hypothetical protein